MDITLMILITLLLPTMAFIFINHKRASLRRKKIKEAEENKRAKVFEEALKFIEQYCLMDNEVPVSAGPPERDSAGEGYYCR